MSVTMLPSGGSVNFTPTKSVTQQASSEEVGNALMENITGVDSDTRKFASDLEVGSSNDPLNMLGELAKKDPSYLDSYLQSMIQRENTTRALDWYERMSSTQYRRAIDDIKAAGYNPYLVLQSLSGAGSGSVSPAGSEVSGYRTKTERESTQANLFKSIASIAGIAVAIAAAVL